MGHWESSSASDPNIEDRTAWRNVSGQAIYEARNDAFPGWQKLTNWKWMDRNLQSENTKIVYFGVDGSVWHLAGSGAGAEGVVLLTEVQGMTHIPFDQKWSEGPHIPGAILERTDLKKRESSFGVMCQPNGMYAQMGHRANWASRALIEERWWNAWSRTKPGHWGVFTRTHGWRFLQVQLGQHTDTTLTNDPAAFKNHSVKWDMHVVAAWPFYAKKPLTAQWQNTADRMEVDPKDGISKGTGYLRMANRGQFDAYAKYLVTGPGKCWIEDGAGTGNMIPLPKLLPTDGYMGVDTFPTARTITGSKDPVDNPFYRFIRDAELIDFFLHDLGQQGLPLWRRDDWNGYVFQVPIPPKTAVRLKVQHDNPNGTVSALVHQYFETPWG